MLKARYLALLYRIHLRLRPRTYVEIGVHHGDSLGLTLPGTDAVGIDPAPTLRGPNGCGARMFETSSDEFFAEHDLRDVLGGRALDLAFIDGLHLFEQALSDFAHLERHAHAESLILVHDCYPIDAATSARERTTLLWSGDVWKLVLCLKDSRPDLRISVVDVAPTGLAVISGLDPGSSVLCERFDELRARYIRLGYEKLDRAGKAAALNRVPGDWPTVAGLLPAVPYRGESPVGLRVQRRARRARSRLSARSRLRAWST
jgi:Methyltransferase domain